MAAHPSFDYRSERSKELHQEIKSLWDDRRIRLIVMAVAWSQIPLGFGTLFGCWAVLMFVPVHGAFVALLLMGVAAGAAACGGLFHDSNHKATFSPFGLSRRLDYIMAWFVSEVAYGLSGYHWSRKHEFHHNETNIAGLDGDLDIEPMFRLHPAKPVGRLLVRYQHIYAWFLYFLFPLPLQIRGHWIAIRGGRHGAFRIPRARGWELAGSLAGPPLFYAWTVGIPIWRFGWVAVLYFLAVYSAVGVYGMFFQLAHLGDEVDFPTLESLQGFRKEGFVHQVETTADFAPGNWLLSYFSAGLTHQAEHHVDRRKPFPFYWFMARVLKSWCLRHGIPYHAYPSLWAAIKAHGRHLRAMAREGHFLQFEMG